MICDVCRDGMTNLWNPQKANRLGHIKEFPQILCMQYPTVDLDDVDNELGALSLV